MKTRTKFILIIITVVTLNAFFVSHLLKLNDLSKKTYNEDIRFTNLLNADEIKPINIISGNSVNSSIISDIENIKESREFYSSEKKRIEHLKETYVLDNIIPIKKMEERNSDDVLYFDNKNNTIIYPTSEMSDDELITIIDFNNTINNYIKLQLAMPMPDVDLLESDAIELARKYIMLLYTDNPTIEDCLGATYNGSEGEVVLSLWTVMFKSNEITYIVDLNSKTGNLVSIDKNDSILFSESTEITDIKKINISDYEKTANELLKKIDIKTDKIHTKYIPFKKKSIYIVYEINSEQYAEIEISYPQKKFISLYFYNDKNTMATEINRKIYSTI